MHTTQKAIIINNFEHCNTDDISNNIKYHFELFNEKISEVNIAEYVMSRSNYEKKFFKSGFFDDLGKNINGNTIVSGNPNSGKTRTLTEVLSLKYSEYNIYIPHKDNTDEEYVFKILDHFEEQYKLGGKMVLFLDDIDKYIGTWIEKYIKKISKFLIILGTVRKNQFIENYFSIEDQLENFYGEFNIYDNNIKLSLDERISLEKFCKINKISYNIDGISVGDFVTNILELEKKYNKLQKEIQDILGIIQINYKYGIKENKLNDILDLYYLIFKKHIDDKKISHIKNIDLFIFKGDFIKVDDEFILKIVKPFRNFTINDSIFNIVKNYYINKLDKYRLINLTTFCHNNSDYSLYVNEILSILNKNFINDHEIYFINSIYNLKIKNFILAIEYIEKSLKILNENTDNYNWYYVFFKGKLLFYNKEYNKSIIILNTLNDNSKKYQYLGLNYEALGDMNKAIYYLDKSIKYKKDNGDAYFSLGKIYKNLNNYDEAIKLFYKTINSSGFFKSRANKELGEMYYKKHEYSKALDFLNDAINDIDDDEFFFSTRGNIFFKLNNYKSALKDFRRTNELNNDNVWAKFCIIEILYIQDKFELIINNIDSLFLSFSNGINDELLIIKLFLKYVTVDFNKTKNFILYIDNSFPNNMHILYLKCELLLDIEFNKNNCNAKTFIEDEIHNSNSNFKSKGIIEINKIITFIDNGGELYKNYYHLLKAKFHYYHSNTKKSLYFYFIANKTVILNTNNIERYFNLLIKERRYYELIDMTTYYIHNKTYRLDLLYYYYIIGCVNIGNTKEVNLKISLLINSISNSYYLIKILHYCFKIINKDILIFSLNCLSNESDDIILNSEKFNLILSFGYLRIGNIELSKKYFKKILISNDQLEALNYSINLEKHKFKKSNLGVIVGASEGGLFILKENLTLIDVGFIPTSNMSAKFFPKLNGDNHSIKLILDGFLGDMIDCKEDEDSYNFSGFHPIYSEIKAINYLERINKIKIDSIVMCEIIKINDFGFNVKFNGIFEGLIHLSEIKWGFVSMNNSIYKLGDKIEAKIISKDTNSRIGLSIKRLKDNPYVLFYKYFNIGDILKCKIISKKDKLGIFLQLPEGIRGLVHISQIGEKYIKNLDGYIIGNYVICKIININYIKQDIGLTFKNINLKSEIIDLCDGNLEQYYK